MSTARDLDAVNMVNVAIVDLDRCLVNTTGKNPHLLSDELIEMLKKFEYIYVCTHRCYFTLACTEYYPYWLQYYQNLFEEKKFKADAFNMITSRVIKNAEAALNKKFIAVSTPDDSGLGATVSPLEEQCGFGYNLILSFFEDEILKNNQDKKLATMMYDGVHRHPYFSYYGKYPDYPHNENVDQFLETKNPQLIQIMHHARSYFNKLFGVNKAVINMEYLDDLHNLCWDVGNIPVQSIPPLTNLRSHHFISHEPTPICFDNPVAVAGRPQPVSRFSVIDLDESTTHFFSSLGSTAMMALGMNISLAPVDIAVAEDPQLMALAERTDLLTEFVSCDAKADVAEVGVDVVVDLAESNEKQDIVSVKIFAR